MNNLLLERDVSFIMTEPQISSRRTIPCLIPKHHRRDHDQFDERFLTAVF